MKTIPSLAAAAALSLGVTKAALVSHYTFDETSGTTAVDSGSAGADGVIGSGVTIGAPGVYGTAFTFNNENSADGVVDFGNATGLFNAINTSGQITIAVWLKWDGLSGTAVRDAAVSLGVNNNGNFRYLDVGIGNNASGEAYAYGRTRNAGGTTGNNNDTVRSADVGDGQWHHIAYTADAATATARLYIDGVQAGADNIGPAGAFFPAFNDFEVGRLVRQSPADAFAGSIDDLRIYDEVLSPDAIAALATIPEPGSVALLGFGALSLGLRRRR